MNAFHKVINILANFSLFVASYDPYDSILILKMIPSRISNLITLGLFVLVLVFVETGKLKQKFN